MKKISVWLLVLSFVFGCVGALAENNRAMEFELTLEVTADAFPVTEPFDPYGMGYNWDAITKAEKEYNQALADLLSLISLRGIVRDGDVIEEQLSIHLKDTPLMTVNTGKLADGRIAYDANFFPSFAFVLTVDEYNQLMEENKSTQLENALAEMAAPALDILTEIAEELQAKVTALESGNYVFDGVTYDQKVTVKMTCEEYWAILTKAGAKAIPLMEKLLVTLGAEGDPETMEKAVKDIENAPLPDEMAGGMMTMELYTWLEGPSPWYLMVNLDTETTNTFGTIRTNGEEMCFDIMSGPATYENAVDMNLAAAKGTEDIITVHGALTVENENTMAIQFEYACGDDYQRHEVALMDTDTEGEIIYQLFQGKEEDAVLKVSLKGWATNAEMPAMDVGEKNLLPYMETLADIEFMTTGGEESGDTMMLLMNDVTKAANGLLIQAIMAAPTEIQAVMDASTALNNAYFSDFTPYEGADEMELDLEGESF